MSVVCWFAVGSAVAEAAVITVVNLDNAEEGLNDTTPAVPVGGNPGTTLGEQRAVALAHAAAIWADALAGGVEIRIAARFNPLGGTPTGAVLAVANPLSFHVDFPGAPEAGVFYPAPLANGLAGSDLHPSRHELRTTFNSDVDDATVLGPVDYYYGLDGLSAANVDFVTVALHEIAHGLGFLPFFELGTGEKRSCPSDPAGGCDDSYTRPLVDQNFLPDDLPSMSNAQRAAAVTDEPDLTWAGAAVAAASGFLSGGVRPDGRVEMHAPAALESGASVSHLHADVSPDELMEAAYRGPTRDIALTTAFLVDIGWRVAGATSTTTSTTGSPSSTVTTTTSPSAAPCGDANGDGSVTSTDALIALNAAVGNAGCDASICDTDSNGNVSASDANRILQYAVGQPVELDCPGGPAGFGSHAGRAEFRAYLDPQLGGFTDVPEILPPVPAAENALPGSTIAAPGGGWMIELVDGQTDRVR